MIFLLFLLLVTSFYFPYSLPLASTLNSCSAIHLSPTISHTCLLPPNNSLYQFSPSLLQLPPFQHLLQSQSSSFFDVLCLSFFVVFSLCIKLLKKTVYSLAFFFLLFLVFIIRNKELTVYFYFGYTTDALFLWMNTLV